MNIVFIKPDSTVVETNNHGTYKHKINQDIILYVEKNLVQFNEISECINISLTNEEFEKIINIYNEIKKQTESKIR